MRRATATDPSLPSRIDRVTNDRPRSANAHSTTSDNASVATPQPRTGAATQYPASPVDAPSPQASFRSTAPTTDPGTGARVPRRATAAAPCHTMTNVATVPRLHPEALTEMNRAASSGP